MTSKPDDLCGFCDHALSEHPERESIVATNGNTVGGRWWPCTHKDDVVECTCVDFAVPGSVMSVGVFPTESGDAEGN